MLKFIEELIEEFYFNRIEVFWNDETIYISAGKMKFERSQQRNYQPLPPPIIQPQALSQSSRNCFFNHICITAQFIIGDTNSSSINPFYSQ